MTAHVHDHGACRSAALDAAHRLAQSRGLRLTPTRARVLEIVAESHKPLGAYDILERLSGERGRVAPPTIYRALSFLVEQGFVHRIEQLNAFVACFGAETSHEAGFLICETCKTVEEVAEPALARAIAAAVSAHRFKPTRAVVEITGLCATCAKA